MMEDRVLPHSLEAERAVLGAVLVTGRVERAADILKADAFFRRGHREMFEAMIALDQQRQPIDMLVLKAELIRRGSLDECGGPAYLAALTDGVPNRTNVAHYAQLVKDAAIRRRVIQMANDCMADAYDGERPAADVVQRADAAIVAIQRNSDPGDLIDLRATQGDLYRDLEYRSNNRGALFGIETGFPSINDLTHGWQRGDMVVVAARPSIGKTAFVLNTVVAAARAGQVAAVFSLEMSRQQLEYRILSHLSTVPLTRLLGGYMGEDDYTAASAAMGVIHDLPVFINDRAAKTAGEIRSACRRLKAERGLDLIAIDYVQLMRGTVEGRQTTRNEQITDISRRLKELAGEVDAPLLLLSQLNRAGDSRSDKRPILSDLRESGALEQDADLVCFLHRKHHRESGPTEFILEKQRNGPTGTVMLAMNRDVQTFTDAGPELQQPEFPEAPPAPDPTPAPPKGWRKKPRKG